MDHTPTPWEYKSESEFSGRQILAVYGINRHIAITSGNAEANAQFIVEAVNVYEPNQETIKGLIEALGKTTLYLQDLKDVMRDYTTPEIEQDVDNRIRASQQVLKRAKGE